MERGSIAGVRICPGAPTISHLLFANDSIIFAKAMEVQANAIKNLLELYEAASDQQVNYSKTDVAFSKGIPEELRRRITQILNIKEVLSHEKYLGLPMHVGRSKRQAFLCIKDMVSNRLHGWGEKFFSWVGREVLIKVVAQSILTYTMSIFKLPTGLCHEIQSIILKYWWASKADARKIHWVRKDQL